MTNNHRASVAIVGFGPTGMFMAGLLGQRGIDVIVVDRADDVFPLPRAAHLDHTVLRVLQELDCVGELLERMVVNSALVLADAELEPLATISASARSRSGYAASMFFYQPEFDRTLARVVGALPGVTVLRGVEMTRASQGGDGVTVECRNVHTDEPVTISADWLIGCDGSWSSVREGLGIGLTSLDFDEEWLVLDLHFDGDMSHVPSYALQVCDPSRPWVSNPVPGNRYRVEIKLLEGDQIDTVASPEFLAGFLQPLFGDSPFTVERNAVYTFHGLIADRWRDGRVLIAGDAAHQMPPFLGQGMCAGIRDAANLAWKLAGVIRGLFPPSILDTYEHERAPHALSVVASAIEVGSFVSVSDRAAVEERNRALRAGDLERVPSFRVPPLLHGPLVGDGGGVQFPQPVNPSANLPVLDSVLGYRTVILSLDPLSGSEELDWWRSAFDVHVVHVAELGEDADEVRAWFERTDWKVVVIRPDHYVMTGGHTIAEITDGMRSKFGALAQIA